MTTLATPPSANPKYPLRWTFIPFLGISIGFLAIILSLSKPAWFFGPSPLEKIVWTCDTGRQIFYGPGTAQSLAIVQRIRSLQAEGHLQNLPVLDKPTLISPALLTSDGSRGEIILLSPFSPALSNSLPVSHEEAK